MNRKTFLKSLLVIPAFTLFGKKVFAKNIDSPTVELSDIRDRKFWMIPDHNPYKLPFINSKNKKIETIVYFVNGKEYSPSSEYFGEKIIPLVGNDFYYLVYWQKEKLVTDTFKHAIVGNKLDWWIPIYQEKNNSQYLIDMDSINDTNSHLTIEDKKIIVISSALQTEEGCRELVEPLRTIQEYK